MTRSLAALTALALAAAACSGSTSPTPGPTPTATSGATPPAAPAAPAAAGSYPLTTCVVSGEPLGEMGEPVVRTYDGTEVRFCCKDCIAEFEKDKPKYLAKIREASAKK